MTKLSDTQTVLLSAAASRASGSLLPVPDTVRAKGKALDRSLTALVTRGFAEKRPTQVSDETWQQVEDGRSIGLVITAPGLAAIGVGTDEAGAEAAPPAADRPRGKLEAVLTAIEAKAGATLAELVAATDWQPHTTRAAITRLRQRGFDIRLEERDGRKAYRVTA